MSGIRMKAGDILLIDFPFSDLSQQKRRPVLVLKTSERFSDFICIAITSRKTFSHAIEVSNSDLEKGSIPKTSWIRYDKIFTLSSSTVSMTIGSLKDEKRKQVVQLLCADL